MGCGETLHFFLKTCWILDKKNWTPDFQNLTPGLKKSSFGAGVLPSTVCPLVCISYKPPGIAGTTPPIAGTALMMPKCDRWIPQRFWRPWTRPMCHDKRWGGLIFHMLLVGTQGMTIPHIIDGLFHALLRRFVLSGSCLGGEKTKTCHTKGWAIPSDTECGSKNPRSVGFKVTKTSTDLWDLNQDMEVSEVMGARPNHQRH